MRGVLLECWRTVYSGGRGGVIATVVLATLLAALAVFAVVVDLVHVVTRSNLAGFAEDGGELLVVTLASVTAVAVAVSPAVGGGHPATDR